MDENREKLEELYSTVSKQLLSDKNADVVGDEIHLKSYVPYGISVLPCIDVVLGRPGIPVGKVIELFGWEGCGKTSLALRIVAACQAMGGAALWVETEMEFNDERARQLGVNTDRPYFTLVECDTIESILRAQDKTLDGLQRVNYTKPFVIVTDSITAVPTEHEYKKEFGDKDKVGEEAKRIRAGLKKLRPKLADCKVPSIFINHNISTISAMPGASSKSAGGRALKFFSAVRLELARTGDITREERREKFRVGQKVKITLRKNKVGELARTAFEVDLRNDIGFDVEDNLLDACRWVGVLNCSVAPKDITASTAYTIEIGEEKKQFTRKEWPSIVSELGGVDAVWKLMRETGESNNIINPYGVVI